MASTAPQVRMDTSDWAHTSYWQQVSSYDDLVLPGAWIETTTASTTVDFVSTLAAWTYFDWPTLKKAGLRLIALDLIALLAVWGILLTIVVSAVIPFWGAWLIFIMIGPWGSMAVISLSVNGVFLFFIVVKYLLWTYWVYIICFVVDVLLETKPETEAWVLSHVRAMVVELSPNGLPSGLDLPYGLNVTVKIADDWSFDRDPNARVLPLALAGLSQAMYGPTVGWTWREFGGVLIFLLALCLSYLKGTILRGFKITWWIIQVALVLASLSLILDPHLVLAPLWTLWSILSTCLAFMFMALKSKNFSEAKALARLWFLVIALRVIRILASASLLVRRHRGNARSFNKSMSSFRSVLNQTAMDVGKVIDDIALPNFIRTFRDRVDVQSMKDSLQILTDLGWPVPVSLKDPDMTTVPAQYSGNILSGFDFSTGIRQARLLVDPELQGLRQIAPLYLRSRQYATWENELDTTARYFGAVEYDYPDIGVDEVWSLVGEIFRDSKLTPFSFIIKKWEKRYGLGPFWKDPDSKFPRKLPRWKAIRMMGGLAEFTKTWARTFYYSPNIVPIAGVSVKDEALPERKWSKGIVRTVISAPLSHYIMSTVWNFQSNHNFQYWATPIKVGLPLNGANLSRLAEQHAAYNEHFAGDFRAFDSTIRQQVLHIVKEVRKKGFERHRDFAKICNLIDINYDLLYDKSPLAFTSTGNIYNKTGGLSTGHSATSMDNSVAVTTIYLMLWKDITGLSAHEFRHFNKLSGYGDDHVLSWLKTAPRSWTKENMIKTAEKWGLGLKDEAPNSVGIERIEFLSKFWAKPTSADKEALKKAGVPIPTFITYHNRDKLIGKATAPLKNHSRDYKFKRIVSYLDLTAHHPEVYAELSAYARRLAKHIDRPTHIPTYEDVLRKWYNPKSIFKLSVEESASEAEDPDKNVIMTYGNTSLLDQLSSALSVLPDLLNPVIYNQGYVDWVISRIGERVAWPWHFLSSANDCDTINVVQAVGRRTPYEWLVVNPHVWKYSQNCSFGGLLFRHWLFMAFKWPDSLTPGVVRYIRHITRKMADLQFLINGKVWTDTYRSGIPFWDILLVVLLSFMPDFPALGFLHVVIIPNPLVVIEYVYQAILAKIVASVPPNFKELAHQLRLLERGAPLLIEAPTGSGKSTSLVAFVSTKLAFKWKFVVVVSPRTMIADTTAAYLRDSYGLDVLSLTGTSPFVRRSKVLFVTPAEVFLHPSFVDDDTIVLVDECHLDETLMTAVKTWLAKRQAWQIWMSATPSDANRRLCARFVKLDMMNPWSISPALSCSHPCPTEKEFVSAYLQFAERAVRMSSSMTRFLIFVPKLEHANRLADRIIRSACVLTSQSKIVDTSKSVFIATSVADVGLTLPGVDWVITSDLTRALISVTNEEGVLVDKLVYNRLTPATLKQRMGRTGRTNNGVYSVFSTTGNEGWVSQSTEANVSRLGYDLLRAGVPIAQVLIAAPDFVYTVLGMAPGARDQEESIEAFVKNVSSWQVATNNMHQWVKLGSLSVPGSTFFSDDHADSETQSPEVIIGHYMAGDELSRPVSASRWTAHIVKVCAELALHALEATPAQMAWWFANEMGSAAGLASFIMDLDPYDEMVTEAYSTDMLNVRTSVTDPGIMMVPVSTLFEFKDDK